MATRAGNGCVPCCVVSNGDETIYVLVDCVTMLHCAIHSVTRLALSCRAVPSLLQPAFSSWDCQGELCLALHGSIHLWLFVIRLLLLSGPYTACARPSGFCTCHLSDTALLQRWPSILQQYVVLSFVSSPSSLRGTFAELVPLFYRVSSRNHEHVGSWDSR